MTAINQKMWRDLWHLRGQALAIGLVIASGVATFVMFLSTLDSLYLTRDSFYRDYRFADVFVSLKRAPETLHQRIAAIPGVSVVDTRVVAPITIDIPDFAEPITGVINSLPDHGEPPLNDLFLRAGSTVSSGRNDEVVISEAFAAAHGLRPGDRLRVVIKGIQKDLRIVGTGVTPEYLYQIRPGSVFPDHERHAIMWMARTPLGHAYDMHRAFNSVVLQLEATAKVEEVIERLDTLLTPYGGIGAIAREDQFSHEFLTSEIDQLDNLSGIFPIIFLGVAAFLLNVVVSRLVGTQREQIAVLKAFGYRNLVITLHYVQLVIVIVILGIGLGIGLGTWLGHMLAEIFVTIFGLPYLEFVLHPLVIIKAIMVTGVAALVGTLFAVRTAAQLRPAEAMRPAAPALYRQTLLERVGLQRWLSPPSRMILRHLERQPVKSGLSIIGIALACGTLMTGRFQEDTVTYMMDVQYKFKQRQDVSLAFYEPTSRRALYDLLNLPGVEHGEVYRGVPVRLRYAHRSYRTSLSGVEPGGQILQFLDAELKPFSLPPAGIVLADYFGTILGVKPGDWITVEVLEGKRPTRQVQVVGMVNQLLGVSGYMDLQALNRLLREGPAINGAFLSVDEPGMPEVFRRLKNMPRIAGVVVRKQELINFHKTMEETMLFYVMVASIFAVVITVGVVYNSARITLTERSRELASLRVLGFSRGEISYILLGELAILTLLAMPLGMLMGYGLCGYIASDLETDLYRVPLILEADTYAFAALVVMSAAVVSALMVRRQLDRLDLIAVLKTKE